MSVQNDEQNPENALNIFLPNDISLLKRSLGSRLCLYHLDEAKESLN